MRVGASVSLYLSPSPVPSREILAINCHTDAEAICFIVLRESLTLASIRINNEWDERGRGKFKEQWTLLLLSLDTTDKFKVNSLFLKHPVWMDIYEVFMSFLHKYYHWNEMHFPPNSNNTWMFYQWSMQGKVNGIKRKVTDVHL